MIFFNVYVCKKYEKFGWQLLVVVFVVMSESNR